MIKRLSILTLCVLTVVMLTKSSAVASPPRELWVYCPSNLLVDRNVDQLEKLWKRAHAAGYTTVVLADSKFARLGALGENTGHYLKNIQRVKQIAAANRLKIVPSVFPVGYSNDLLSLDANLAEGLPVKDATFVVHDGRATPVADPPVALSRISFVDDTVKVADGIATVTQQDGNARMVFKLTVPKYRVYHLRAEVKTAGFDGDARMMAIGQGHRLNFADMGIKPTQDWTPVDAIFNSLEETDVSVYLGIWGGNKGTLQWRNWTIEEAGLVNVLRREGTPFSIAGYVEGKDFQPVADPKLGNDPYEGEYTLWHEPPAIVVNGIPDGTRLKVSWSHMMTFNGGQVPISLSEPKTMALLTDQAKRMRELWQTDGYMMQHDEIRCMNWDDGSRKLNMESGALLAKNVSDCTKLLAGSTAYVWSDMFDPYHNAHADYYLVRGDLKNSWAGLNKNVVVVNWNFDKRDESLKFFADRGNRQIIAGYYDGPVKNAAKWLQSADKVAGVQGVMYTTWEKNYDDLEAFAAIVRKE